MSKKKKPAVSPQSGRFAGPLRTTVPQAKLEKKSFDIYVSDIETGDETLAITMFAATQREAIDIAKKRLQTSPLLRR